MRVFSIVFAEILMVVAGALAYDLWPRRISLAPPQRLEHVEWMGGCLAISWRGRALVGTLAEFDDALQAYLMFDYYRGRAALRNRPVFLTLERTPEKIVYRILVRLPSDVISGVTELASLNTKHLASRFEFAWVNPSKLDEYQQQTAIFLNAYQDPAVRDLQDIAPAELQPYVARFIRFKSETDPRTWKATPFMLQPVSSERAERLAKDIVAVAQFYDIPVDVFLGIGAMENNFLDAPGDLNNAVWKRRVERDDIVLQHKGRRVWVLNSSIGVWQITRQSLRHAQKLFLADKERDYALLPERLRPDQKLDMENLDESVLTTYAGLLLRELLDEADGDTQTATGAYNGTVRQPNYQYAAGVEMVASYARRVIGCTAELNHLATAQLLAVQANAGADVNARTKPVTEHPVSTAYP